MKRFSAGFERAFAFSKNMSKCAKRKINSCVFYFIICINNFNNYYVTLYFYTSLSPYRAIRICSREIKKSDIASNVYSHNLSVYLPIIEINSIDEQFLRQ